MKYKIGDKVVLVGDEDVLADIGLDSRYCNLEIEINDIVIENERYYFIGVIGNTNWCSEKHIAGLVHIDNWRKRIDGGKK